MAEVVLFTFTGSNGSRIAMPLGVGDHDIADKTLTLVDVQKSQASPDLKITIYSDEAPPYKYPCGFKDVNKCLFPKKINKISIHKFTLSKTPFYIIIGVIGGLIVIGLIIFAIRKYMQKQKKMSNTTQS